MSVNFTNLDHFGILMPKKDWCLWLNWHLPFFLRASVICFQENKPKILEPSVGSSGRPEEKSTSSFIHSTLVLIIQQIPLCTLSLPLFPSLWYPLFPFALALFSCFCTRQVIDLKTICTLKMSRSKSWKQVHLMWEYLTRLRIEL